MSSEVMMWSFDMVERVSSTTKWGWTYEVRTSMLKLFTGWKVIWELKWIEYLKWHDLIFIEYMRLEAIVCHSKCCVDMRSEAIVCHSKSCVDDHLIRYQ